MSEERFPALTAETMSEDQRRVAAAIVSGPRKGLRGPFKALLASPELADRVQRVGAYIRFESALPARLNELAILLVARKWTAQFEFYAHAELARAAGLDPAIIAAIAVGKRPPSLAADESDVYTFCAELLETTRVSDPAFLAVWERFGERGVIDLIGALGYYSLVSMVLNVDRVSLPDGVALPLQPLKAPIEV
jgi:4-carboxymuconolactone decarboxylase